TDTDRWQRIGVARSKIKCTGSIKYDPDVQTQSQVVAVPLWDAPIHAPDSAVLFGGSTHRGEEEILAAVFLRLRQQFPSLRLFIAPRHVERLQEIRAQLDALELRAELLRDSKARQSLVENAREVLSAHQGATARAAALIHELHSSL